MESCHAARRLASVASFAGGGRLAARSYRASAEGCFGPCDAWDAGAGQRLANKAKRRVEWTA